MTETAHIPTLSEIKRQFPLFKALVIKDIKLMNRNGILSAYLKFGIVIFLTMSLFAFGSYGEEYSSQWDEDSFFLMMSLVIPSSMSLLLFFTGEITSETFKGTFRTVSLYPVGFNNLISSKIAYEVLTISIPLLILFVSGLLPFYILGIIPLQIIGYFVGSTLLFNLAFLLVIGAGAYYSAIPASYRSQQIYASVGYAFTLARLLSYWPVRAIFTLLFGTLDPNERFFNEETAAAIASGVSRFSPFEFAYRLSKHYILGDAFDLSYLLSVALFLLIALRGVRYGPRVYMDVFFRRG